MDVARYHRLRSAYYRLEGQRCRGCERTQFPSAPRCQSCGGEALFTFALSGRGAVYSFAELDQPPAGFPGPYVVALVELEEGPRVAAQLTDVDAAQVAVGMPVEMVTRKLRELGSEGYLVYGYKFRPAAGARS